MNEKRKVGRPKLINKAYKNKLYIIIALCVLIILILFFCGLYELKLYNLVGASKPVKIKRINTDSTILIIGDSRMRDICHSINKKDSCLAFGGGRYYPYKVDPSRKINSTEYENLAKKTIDAVIKKYGTINVYVVATINDYYYGLEIAKKGASEALSFANKLKKYNTKANVYICGLIKSENGISADYYNDFVKSEIKSKYPDLLYLNITPSNVYYTDGIHFKDNTSENINKIFEKTAKPNKCKLVILDRKISGKNDNNSSVKYKLTCNIARKIKDISISGGATAKKPTYSDKVLTGEITNLNQAKAYELKLTDSNGFKYNYRFSPIDVKYIKKLSPGNCPITLNINGIKKNLSEYKLNEIGISINASNLTSEELNKIYIIYKNYNHDRNINYKINGISKSEKIGDFYTGYTIPITSLSKNNGDYVKQFKFENYFYIIVYSGSKVCQINYVVKDGYEINNNARYYKLSQYNIISKNGIINGYNDEVKFTSSDKKILNGTNINNYYCKSTSMNSKNGSEKEKAATIVMSNKNISASFKLRLPNSYWTTGYLINPLTNNNTPLEKVNEITRTNNTIQTGGEKSYGVELPASNDSKVYAMDSGVVKIAANGASNKHNYGNYIQIESGINNEKYIHTYAHLKKINVRVGDRVYKGQVIGNVGRTSYKGQMLNNPILFVSLSHVGSKYNEALLINNFIGRNLSYANVTTNNYLIFQKYIDDYLLLETNKFCNDK